MKPNFVYCISEIVFGVVLFCSQFGGLAGSSEEIVHSASCKLLDPGFDIATDNDIGTAIVSDPTHCCAICEKTTGCRAWAWNYIGPTCSGSMEFLPITRGTFPSLESTRRRPRISNAKDRTTRAGLLGDLATCSLHKGFDIAPGNDLAWHRAETPKDCCGICAAIPECKAWTHNVSPPRCYLKTTTTLVPANTTVAGIVREVVANAEKNEVNVSNSSENQILSHEEDDVAGPAPVSYKK